MNSHPCTVCGEAGHPMRRCPTLCSPLKDGFYAPPAGHRPSGDEDDEKACLSRCAGAQMYLLQVLPSPQSVFWRGSSPTLTGDCYLSAMSFPLCNLSNTISGTI